MVSSCVRCCATGRVSKWDSTAEVSQFSKSLFVLVEGIDSVCEKKLGESRDAKEARISNLVREVTGRRVLVRECRMEDPGLVLLGAETKGELGAEWERMSSVPGRLIEARQKDMGRRLSERGLDEVDCWLVIEGGVDVFSFDRGRIRM